MSKFRAYRIDLLMVTDDTQSFTYELTDEYFEKIDSPEIQKGNLTAVVEVQKRASSYELSFSIDGTIQIPCDRCLDEMNQEVHCEDNIKVKLGEDYTEEDDIIIVPKTEGYINVAWFLYEFIVLNIPIKHVHPIEECNIDMMKKLKEHLAFLKDDEENALLDIMDEDEELDIEEDTEKIDPRWKDLGNIQFENN